VAYLIRQEKNTYHQRNMYQTCCYCNQSNYERRQCNWGNKRNTIACWYHSPIYQWSGSRY